MSDKAPRSIPEITQEYSNLCAKAGQIQYNIYVLNRDLDLLNDSIKDLNFEAASANKLAAEAKEQAEAAAAAAATEVPNA